jgi:ATP-dependent Lon protease
VAEKKTDIQRLAEKVLAKLPPQHHALINRLVNKANDEDEEPWVFNYLMFLDTLPWQKSPEPDVPFRHVKRMLAKSHHGMEEIKDLVTEYISVLKLQKDKTKTPILLFVGPPGVGKSSICQSIGKAMKRPVETVFLGGMEHANQIRGDRKVYRGAEPGHIIKAFSRAKSSRPVIVLDEVDKAEQRVNYALLELLDYTQNHKFKDMYVDLEFDASGALFILTANSLDTIHPALLDRCEVIELSAYTEKEKIRIGRDFLLPKVRKDFGLHINHLCMDQNGIAKVVREYTDEAGVRRLAKLLAKIGRKVARQVVEKKRTHKRRLLTDAEIVAFLGPPRVRPRDLGVLPPGSVYGLAFSEQGGIVDAIEAVLVEPRRGRPATLRLTGEPGIMMVESSKIVMSVLKSQAERLGLTKWREILERDVHIHFASGVGCGTDGPSAGVTMFVALYTLLKGVRISANITMTGEVNLRGHVTQIGGLKEKLMAAHRKHKTKIIIPRENVPDLVTVPEDVLAEMTVVPVGNIDELLEACDFHSDQTDDSGRGPAPDQEDAGAGG